jgi:hypothetical protein
MQFSKGVLMDKSALCILILFIPLVKADLLLSRFVKDFILIA